jgi:TonB-linked SusC/RagA family outer membrane protein
MKKFKYLLVLYFLFPLSLLAQQTIISGKVIDSKDGSTLPGVSVKIKGTTIGVVTDLNGKFQLSVPAADATLQLSYVGYTTQEIKAADVNNGTIALQATSNNLNEVVVVGYGTQKRETITGSVATLKSKEITLTKNESVVNMLTGKIPGLRILQKTAEPGGYDNTIDIRGYGAAPLVVIDGVPSGGLERMDPNEIESISVLKDAAASIYGVRAANGVILVTTKKGDKNGKFDINYSVNQGYQQFLGMPEGVDAVDYMLLTNEKTKRDFNNNFIANQIPTFSYADIKPWLDGTYKSADWIGAAFKKSAPQIQHNLNVNGGTEKISYFFNFGYMKQDGVFKSGDLNYDRYNFRSNVTVNITDRLKAQILTSGNADQKNQPYWDQWTIFKYTWNQIPTNQIYANNNPLYPNVMPDNANPAVITDADIVGSRAYKNKNFQGQLSLQYDIPGVKGLVAKAMYNYQYGVTDNNIHRKEFNLYSYDAATDIYTPGKVQSPSFINRAYYTNSNTLTQFSLNYVNTFFKNHNVSATLVYEQTHGTGDNFYAQRNVELPIDYIFGGLTTDQLGYMYTGGNDLYEIATRSIIGRFNYDYKGKYLAEFSFRRDGSNKYMPGPSQYGFFPAVSIGWRLTEEPFIRNLISPDILSNLKLRASYGETGDEAGTTFNYLDGFTYPVNGYIFGGNFINGSTVKTANPTLSWTTSTTKNVGLDFTLFKGKLDGTVEAFRRDRKGLPFRRTVTIPGTVGVTLAEENLESDRTEGLELSLTHRSNIGQVGYFITGNVGTTRTMKRYKVEGNFGNEMEQWRNSQTDRYQNIWWGVDYGGQFTNYNQIYNHPVNTGGGNNSVIPGDYYYKDWNEDGVIDGKDNHPIATTGIPLVNYGLNIGINYKGFDLNMLLQGGTSFYVKYAEQYAQPLMYGRSALTRFLDSWHTVNPTDNVFDPNTQWVSGYYPAMGSAPADGTKAIQDATYLRIKTLELGYSLPATLLKKIGVKRLRVYANSYNLATFTGLKNYDPEHPGEMPDKGFDDALGGYKYPMNRTFNLGANVSF